MSAFERAAVLFERMSALPSEERAAALAAEPDAEVRELVRDMLAGEDDPHSGLDSGLPGMRELVAGALDESDAEERRTSSDALKLELAGGPYRVLGVLAKGGMGVVLRGRDEEIGRNVAIKVLRDPHGSGSENARLRFIEEAQVAGQLEHPGIVPVYHLGTDDAGRPFFAMKLVEGETLAARLGRRADPFDERARFLGLFLQVCQTVAYAHARRVIHRDLKPANVMVGAFGEVQVLDWGLAKVLGTSELAGANASEHETALETVRTRTESGSASVSGTVMGTPRYMPPEQAQGEVELLDRRSDVFSLGAILCELLTGEPPFPGEREEALRAAREGRVEPALERLAACRADPALVALACRCLATLPAERPADASVLAAEIERSLTAVEERAHAAELAAEAARASATAERKARRLTLVLTSSAAVFAVVVVALFLWRAYERERGIAELSGEVAAALDVADERFAVARTAPLEERAPWDAAALALDAAASILAGGETTADVRERTKELRAAFDAERAASEAAAAVLARDRALVARLDEIRMPTLDSLDPYDYPRMEADYRTAFAGYGIDVDDEATARARLAESAIARELGLALDQWALSHRIQSPEDAPDRDERFQRLLALAAAADPDPERDRVRAALLALDAGALRALAAEPGTQELAPESILLVASGLRITEDHAAAVALLEPAVRRHPGDFWLSLHAALALRALEDLASVRASAYFHGALGARPGSLQARHLLGQNLHALGRLQEARGVFEELTRLAPENGHWYAHLGQLIAEVDGRAAALDAVTEAARLAPDDTYALSWYGRTLEETGAPWEAVEPLRRASEIDDDVDSLMRYGIALMAAGREAEALEVFQEVLAREPGVMEALYNGGTIAHSFERYELAEELLRRCTELYPVFPQAWCNLANVLSSAGRFEESAELYRRCDELGRVTRDWNYPSAEWAATAERGAIFAGELEVYREGAFDPADEDYAIELATVALRTGWTATASDWWIAIHAERGDLEVADLELAARSAGLANAGVGEDARELGADERAAQAELALFWLETLRAGLMDDFREDPRRELQAVHTWLEIWQRDPAYAGMREPAAEHLPPGLREDVARFWSGVQADLDEIAATFEGEG